jgi:rhodanese-related sulfurtransferase
MATDLRFHPPVNALQPRLSAIHRPPKSIGARDFQSCLWEGAPPILLDVREESQFRARHIEDSIHAPDSNPAGLVRLMQEHGEAILVCENGRMSSTVARMMGVCGFSEVRYLEGGIQAWVESGGALMETTPAGRERRLGPSGKAEGPGPIGRVVQALSPRVFFIGLAASAAILGLVCLLSL